MSVIGRPPLCALAPWRTTPQREPQVGPDPVITPESFVGIDGAGLRDRMVEKISRSSRGIGADRTCYFCPTDQPL
jgi:hypothetical protein